MMQQSNCTIVVSPRERFDVAVRSLESVVENTERPYDLVYVLAGGSRSERRRIRELCESQGFRVVEASASSTPNECRNLGLQAAATEYVAFLDNDVLVQPGWLSSLVDRARTTGAAAVSPLLLQGEPERREIHLAGGSLRWAGEAPRRTFRDEHLLQGSIVEDVVDELKPGPCDFVEYHCCVVRRSELVESGGCDERLLNTREHLDLSLTLQARGGQIEFEPSAVVTYFAPTRIRLADAPFYFRRWSGHRTDPTLAHFCQKWGVDPEYVRQYSTTGRREVAFKPWADKVGSVAGRRAGALLLKAMRRAEPAITWTLVRSDVR